MDAGRTIDLRGLWDAASGLPGPDVLVAVAERCGRAWDMPDLHRRVRIGYNPRLRTTLGRAVLNDRRVELNVRLLRRHPAELIPTLVHELAHLAVHMRYGRVAPHGREFRTLTAAVGMPGGATHDLPVGGLKRTRRRYLYLHRCSDCGATFVARSVRRDTYCRECGPEMSWTVWRAPATSRGRRALEQMRDAAETGE